MWDANFQKSFQKWREKVDSNALKETLHWAGTQHNVMYKMQMIQTFKMQLQDSLSLPHIKTYTLSQIKKKNKKKIYTKQHS